MGQKIEYLFEMASGNKRTNSLIDDVIEQLGDSIPRDETGSVNLEELGVLIGMRAKDALELSGHVVDDPSQALDVVIGVIIKVAALLRQQIERKQSNPMFRAKFKLALGVLEGSGLLDKIIDAMANRGFQGG